VLVLLLLVPMFSTAIRVQATTYLWSTFHGDNARTGYSSAAAPTTNNIEWTYTTGDMVFSSPAIAYDKVFIGSYDGNMYALNQNNGGCEWSFNAGEPIVSSPAVADNEVFFCTQARKSIVWRSPPELKFGLAQSERADWC
jgi:outer membrane protein assembly factor BamB